MLCNKSKKLFNLSTHPYKSCFLRKCGGWKFIDGGRSGAWLSAASVCSMGLFHTYFKEQVNSTPSSSSSSSSSQDESVAYFRVSDGFSSDFVVGISTPSVIQSARRQLAGLEPPLRITGLIILEQSACNPNYSYYYDPSTVDFFELAMEVCDATFQYTQDHLSEVGGAFLPGNRLCPWNSYLIEEVYCGSSYSSSSSSATASSSSSSTTPRYFCVSDKSLLFDKGSWSSIASEPFKTYMDQAADRWTQFIKFNSQVHDEIRSIIPQWNGIKLEDLGYEEIFEDNSGVIASCGPTQGVDLYGDVVKFNSTHFAITINTYFSSEFGPEDWVNVLTHELGHALGIGIFWDPSITGITGGVAPQDNFLNGAAYTNAQSSYNLITNLERQKIPLESSGGGGTTSAHWENNYRPATSVGSNGLDYPGLENELMVGYYAPGLNFLISPLSIKTLVDFGYEETTPGSSEGIPNLANGANLLQKPGVHLNCSLSNKTMIIKKLDKLSVQNTDCPRCIPESEYNPETHEILAIFDEHSKCVSECGCE